MVRLPRLAHVAAAGTRIARCAAHPQPFTTRGEAMLHAFAWSMDPLELVFRGTAMYWFLFLLFRELPACLREQGIDKLADVKFARLEADGQINVIREPRAAG
jgi:Protein of unknown function (DUF421)